MEEDNERKYQDAFTLAAKTWKDLPPAERKIYEDLNKQDEVRHQKEMLEYNRTGFFTNAEGINSKDLPKLKVKVQAKLSYI